MSIPDSVPQTAEGYLKYLKDRVDNANRLGASSAETNVVRRPVERRHDNGHRISLDEPDSAENRLGHVGPLKLGSQPRFDHSAIHRVVEGRQGIRNGEK